MSNFLRICNSTIHQVIGLVVTGRSMQNGKNVHWLWMGERFLKSIPAGGTQSGGFVLLVIGYQRDPV